MLWNALHLHPNRKADYGWSIALILVKQIIALSNENFPILEKLLQEVTDKLGLPLEKPNHKKPENIFKKASRPSIKAEKEWFDVEHVRDSLRFKNALDSFEDILKIAEIFRAYNIEFIKTDTSKMTSPKEWGWRFVAFDLRMPNGQMVEYYAPLKELAAKGVKDVNHLLFEKWRNKTKEELDKNWDEYTADIDESHNRYQSAYESAIKRLNYKDEVEAAADWANVSASLESYTGSQESFSSSGVNMSGDQLPDLSRSNPTLLPSASVQTNTLSDSRSTETLGLAQGNGITESPSESNIQQGAKKSQAKSSAVRERVKKYESAFFGEDALTIDKNAEEVNNKSDESAKPVQIREPRQPKSRTLGGKKTVIKIPGSNKNYEAGFQVREIADVFPSHNPFNFQPNPDYFFVNDRRYDKEKVYQDQVISRSRGENFDASLLLNNAPTVETGSPVVDADGNVLGGNSRSMMLHRIYQDKDRAARNNYRNLLMEDAAIYGINAKELINFKHPVLVREISDESITAQAAITDLNKTSTTDLTTSEKAVSEAGMLNDSAIEYITKQIERAGNDATLSDALNNYGNAVVKLTCA